MICQLQLWFFARFSSLLGSWFIMARSPSIIACFVEARSSSMARLSSCILAFLHSCIFLLERQTVILLMTFKNSRSVEKAFFSFGPSLLQLCNCPKKILSFYIGRFLYFSTVHGNWSSWGAWSHCSETCGNGTSTRSRACDNPTPAHGGDDCVGAASVTQNCFEQACPG